MLVEFFLGALGLGALSQGLDSLSERLENLTIEELAKKEKAADPDAVLIRVRLPANWEALLDTEFHHKVGLIHSWNKATAGELALAVINPKTGTARIVRGRT